MPPIRQLLGWVPARVWRLFGRLARGLKRHRLAARAYGVAAHLAPQVAVNHHDLGTALATLKRHQAAIQAFRQALAIDPQRGRSYRGLARMHRALGQHAASARAFARAVELLPAEALLFFESGESLRHLGRHDAAAQAFANALRLRSDLPGWHRALGRALVDSGQPGEAALALEQVARLQPDNAGAHYEAGRAWLHSGAVQHAREALQRALALQPGHADSLFALRRCDDAPSRPALLAGERVACLLGGGIGNLIQCSPAIRHLSETLGQPIELLLNADFADCACLFEGAPWVGRVYGTVADAAAERFDLLIILDPFSQQLPALQATRLVVPRLDLPLSAMQQLHEAEYYLKGLHEQLGLAYSAQTVGRPFVGGYQRQAPIARRVGLHAGCKSGRWLAKRWPYFEALAQRLTAAGLEVISVGGVDEFVPGTLDRTGLPLHQSIEQIARCAYFISNDSGLMHVADALGVPLTAIFGPSSVTKNGPLAASSQVVQLHKACAPCQFDTPRLKACTCIGEITLEQVWEALSQSMGQLLPPAAPTLIAVQTLEGLSLPERLRMAAKAPDAVERLLADLHQQRYSARLLELLIEVGAWQEARALLAVPLGSLDALLQLGPHAFGQLLHGCWQMGAQEEMAERFSHSTAPLLNAYPDSVLALFDCAAAVLSPAQLDALLLDALPVLLALAQSKPLLRLLDAACRHATLPTLVTLLERLDATLHRPLLHNPVVAGPIGDALIGAEPALHLPHSGLRAADFCALAAPQRLIEQALLAGERALFIQRVNRFLGQHQGADNLSRLLKNYTQHTARLQLAEGEIGYAISDAHADNLLLAIILDDRAMVQRCMRQCPPSSQATLLWQSRQHEYSPLNHALARWLGAVGARPLQLAGANRLELFHSCLAGAPLPPAEDHGLVSVILCVHNPEPELLRLAVASVLGQNYRNLQLIVVDDGNDAACQALLASLAGPRVRLVRNPQNGGVYQCRNLGVAAAEGAFVAFHDADDIAHPQRIQLQLEALLNTPGCQLCFANHMRFDADGSVQLEINPDRLNVLGDGPVTALLRRRTLEIVGPFVEVRTRGDIEMRQRLEKCFGKQAIRHVPAPLMYCAGGPGTLSNSAQARYRQQIRLLRRSFQLRLWPPVVADALLCPPVGKLAVPYALRSSTQPGETSTG